MKKPKYVLMGLTLASALVALGQSEAQAPATGAPAGGGKAPTKVGVMAAQSAILSTRDGQKALADLNKRMEPRKVELDKKAQEIRDLQDKLQRGGNAMADAAKRELQNSIDSKTKSYNRDMEDAQAEAEQEQHKMLDDLSGKMSKVIESYAAANGFAMILDDGNPNTPVLWVATTVEITKEIVDLYDKTYPVAAQPAGTGTPAGTKPSLPKPMTPTVPPTTKKQP